MTIFIATKGRAVDVESFEDWAVVQRERGHLKIRDKSRTPAAKRRDESLRQRRAAKRTYQRAFGARDWGRR